MLHVSVISIGVTDAGWGLASRDSGICIIESEARRGEIILLHIWQNICMVDEYQVLDIVWPSLIKGKNPTSPKSPKTSEFGDCGYRACDPMHGVAKPELSCALPPIVSSFSRRDAYMKPPIPSHLIVSTSKEHAHAQTEARPHPNASKNRLLYYT